MSETMSEDEKMSNCSALITSLLNADFTVLGCGVIYKGYSFFKW